MREILFRGKRVDNGEWVEGYYFKAKRHWNDIGVHEDWIADGAIQNGGWCNVVSKHAVIPTSISEFTGLTDKNGKKIFEGDIIRYADIYEYYCYLESLEHPEGYRENAFKDMWTVDKVVYDIKNGYPAFDLYEHDFDCNGLSELKESMQYYYEVIGNIHDNNALIGGGENA